MNYQAFKGLNDHLLLTYSCLTKQVVEDSRLKMIQKALAGAFVIMPFTFCKGNY